MSRKALIWLIILLVAAGVGLYAWKQYTRTNKDLLNVTADVTVTADGLVKEYETNDSAANKKYLGKIIEITGNIKKIEKDEKGYYTIVLGDTSTMSSVRCAMDSVHVNADDKLITGLVTTLRGACTGFNKDDMGLGSDVILNRCVIIKQKND
jgi:hypothetical protein